MTPAQEFRNFILKQIRGKEIISPTLLSMKLDSLIRQEKTFARDAYYIGHSERNFDEWYNKVSKEESSP